MTERPILFSAPMVRALLAGTKTQTRRIVKGLVFRPDAIRRVNDDDRFTWSGKYHATRGRAVQVQGLRCPYGVPGDALWVRENLAAAPGAIIRGGGCEPDFIRYAADEAQRPIEDTEEAARRWLSLYRYDHKRRAPGPLVPAIHMPRWACRVVLLVQDVRVERLNDISAADCLAEGIEHRMVDSGYPGAPLQDGYFFGGGHDEGYQTAQAAYGALWNHINGPGAWAKNPWVWAVTAERAA